MICNVGKILNVVINKKLSHFNIIFIIFTISILYFDKTQYKNVPDFWCVFVFEV